MAKQRPIQIGCPNYQKLVPGSYDCDNQGNYLVAEDGAYLVERVHCGHLAGKCAQTLCILHRHNRGGPKSWFPSRIVAAPKTRKAPRTTGTSKRRPASERPTSTKRDDGLDVIA